MNQPDFLPANESPGGATGRESALDWPRRKGMTSDVLAELTTLSHRRRRRRVATLASLVTVGLVVLGGVFWPSHPQEAMEDHSLQATVAIAEPTRQTLTDGTVVEWKDEVIRTVEFTPSVRRIVQRRGTAHYQVVKDATRPFVVEAGGVQVRAVGTAFTVQIEPTGIEVLVTEGRVTVAAMKEMTGPTSVQPNTLVGAGEHIKVSAAALAANHTAFAVTPLTPDELAERLTWRIPRLKFSGTPLVEAVALFNRHNRRRLVLGDRSMENLQISGILRADNLTALLSLLRMDFGIEAEPRGDDEILLRHAR